MISSQSLRLNDKNDVKIIPLLTNKIQIVQLKYPEYAFDTQLTIQMHLLSSSIVKQTTCSPSYSSSIMSLSSSLLTTVFQSTYKPLIPSQFLSSDANTILFHQELMKPKHKDLSRRIALFLERHATNSTSLHTLDIHGVIDDFLLALGFEKGNQTQWTIGLGLENYVLCGLYDSMYKKCVVGVKVKEFTFITKVSLLNAYGFLNGNMDIKCEAGVLDKCVHVCGAGKIGSFFCKY